MNIAAIKYQIADATEIFIPEFKVAFNSKNEIVEAAVPRLPMLQISAVTNIEIDRSDALLLFYVISSRKNQEKVIQKYLKP